MVPHIDSPLSKAFMDRLAPAVMLAALPCILGLARPVAGAPLEAGGLQRLPERATESVALANPGFEQEWTGWTPERQTAFAITRDERHSGEACLQLDTAASTPYVPSLQQSLPDVSAGIYRLRFWVKTRDINPSAGKTAGARVSLEYHLQNARRLWPSTRVFAGTSDWQLVELEALVQDDVKPGSVLISVHRYGDPSGGEALFDDFALERVLPPAVEAFLLYPNYRGYLPAGPGHPQHVRLWVRVNDPHRGGPARVEVRDEAADRLIASSELPRDAREGVVEFDASRWPTGSYSVHAKLADYEYPPYIIRRISAADQRRFDVWFDDLNVLHLRGRATFPIGLYNTVRKFAVVDDAEISRLDKMAEAPLSFQINYTWWPCSLATRRRYLAEMQKRGIWYLDTVNNVFPGEILLGQGAFPVCDEVLPSAGGRLETQEECDRYLSALAGGMRQFPGHAGWYVMDERPFGMVPELFHQYGVLRAADPDHPTYGVSNRPAELAMWRDTLDVFGLDPYPLMNMRAGTPLSQVGEWTRAGMNATHRSRPVWVVMQFFQGWSTDRWPTEEELRTMSLMAITEGARGLFYWSFGGRGLGEVGDAAVREGYWQGLIKVTAELKRIEPALVAADAPQIVASVSDPRVRWRARSAGGKWFVFAYLPAATFDERAAGPETAVVFTLRDGRRVTRPFRPDTADWFEVPAAPG